MNDPTISKLERLLTVLHPLGPWKLDSLSMGKTGSPELYPPN